MRRRRLRAWSLGWVAVALMAGLSSVAALAQPPVRIDGIAALVGGRSPGPGVDLVLHSDIDLLARLRLARERPDFPLEGAIPARLRVAVRDGIVNEVLIVREARRVAAPEPDDTVLREERQRLSRQAGGERTFREIVAALHVSSEEIDAIVARRAAVAAFLRAQLEEGLEPSDAEVEAFFNTGEHPFPGAELADVREPLRLLLRQERVTRELRRWVEVLRARAIVHLPGTT